MKRLTTLLSAALLTVAVAAVMAPAAASAGPASTSRENTPVMKYLRAHGYLPVKPPLVAGHAFSVEPGIYLPGRFGLRLEDIVVATDAGPERLNHAARDLAIVG